MLQKILLVLCLLFLGVCLSMQAYCVYMVDIWGPPVKHEMMQKVYTADQLEIQDKTLVLARPTLNNEPENWTYFYNHRWMIGEKQKDGNYKLWEP